MDGNVLETVEGSTVGFMGFNVSLYDGIADGMRVNSGGFVLIGASEGD